MLGSRRAWAVLLVVVAPLLGARPARAEGTARLTYVRGAGVESCPDDAAFRAAVAARLGYDPFRTGTGARFSAEVFAAGGELVGHLALVDEAGAASGVREFRAATCGELVAAIALALSLAINPNLAAEPPAAASSAPQEPSAAPPPSDRAPQPAVNSREPSSFATPADASRAPDRGSTSPDGGPSPRGEAPRTGGPAVGLGLMGLGSLGTAPSPNVGGALALRLGVEALSVAVEGRIDAATTAAMASGGFVKSSLAAGLLVPCWHVHGIAACGALLVGRFHAASRGAEAAGQASATYVAAGGRVGVERAFLPHWALELHAELLGTATPPVIVRNGTYHVWAAPPVSADLGLGVIAQIP